MDLELLRTANAELGSVFTPSEARVEPAVIASSDTRAADLNGYWLKVPAQHADQVRSLLQERTQLFDFIEHVIRAGETFWALAKRYGSSVELIVDENPGLHPQRLRPGQTAVVPLLTGPVAATPAALPSGATVEHRVRRRVRRSGTWRSGTAAASNGLLGRNPGVNPRRLRPGLTVIIPLPGSVPDVESPGAAHPWMAQAGSGAVHVVEHGDSLWDIARTHGVTVEALAASNGRSPNDTHQAGRDPHRAGRRYSVERLMDGSAPPGMAARRTRTARPLALIALLPAMVALLTACGERRVGWGVVLWGPQRGIDGSVLSISGESDIQDVYRYTDAETVREIARWRVRLFTDREQAEAFAVSYRDLVHTFGYAARKGLPIREAADARSAQLYRLREGEAVKIIGREEHQATVGDYTNFWYQVLTADGTLGFTFGEFLPLFETGEDPQAEADRLLGEEVQLDRITGVAWRPQYYADMLVRRRIDLTRLNDTYGFTIESGGPAIPTAGEKILPQGAGGLARMRLPELDLAFAFDRIDRIGEQIFVLHGSGVRIVSETRVEHHGLLPA